MSNNGADYTQTSEKIQLCTRLLHSIPAPLCIIDIEGNVLTANDRWYGMFILSKANRPNLIEMLSPQEQVLMVDKCTKIIDGKLPTITLTCTINAPAGSVRTNCALSSFSCGDDCAHFIMCKFDDRSLEDKLENSLQRTYNRISILTEGIHDHLFELSTSGIITFANKDFHHFSRVAMHGSPVSRILPPHVREGWEQAFSRRQVSEFQFKYETDEDETYYRAKVKFVANAEESFAVLTLSDETETFIRTRELLKNKRKLQQSVASKDKFLSIMAHDLKGPFSALISFGQLLSDTIQEGRIDKAERLIRLINESSMHSYNLLENLLTWSRAQRGHIKPAPMRFSIHEAVTDTFELLNAVAFGKEVTFECNTGRNIYAFADYNMIKTVVRNLVSNAIKFSHKGGTIEARIEQKGSYVEVSITDTGTGMRPDVIDSLFKEQKPKSQIGTANERGTGLGLLVCNEFVRYNKGEIHVSSELGKGSVFRFSIPYTD